jgi:hypothetical protein
LIWSFYPPVAALIPVQLQSRWTWFRPTDPSLRARASAVFLKAAKARGYESEDQWLDELRHADFVRFQISGQETEQLPDGTLRENESGVLDDAVKHSITLCHKLEAEDVPKPIIGRLPREAIARMEADIAMFMADFVPKWELEAPTLENRPDTRMRKAELLRELVVHHFETAARECMALFASVTEFETELRVGIARFVHCSVSKYRWLGDTMRTELDMGFTFFMMRANPTRIPETHQRTKWRVGVIIGEALSDTSHKLIAEATARAAYGLRDMKPNGATEPKPDKSNGTDALPTVNAVDTIVDRRSAVSLAQLRQAFVTPILTEKGWSILDWATNSRVDFHTYCLSHLSHLLPRETLAHSCL